jgi:hypothetical protein
MLVAGTRRSSVPIVDELRRFIVASTDTEQTLLAGSLLEAIARLDATLVPIEFVEELAGQSDFSKRSSAAALLWDRAAMSPGDVPLGLLGRLAAPSEDWYVNAPAMAAVKLLMLHRRDAELILEELAKSPDSQDRYAAADALLDVARTDASAVPPALVDKLVGDPDDLVSGRAREVRAAIGAANDEDYRRRFMPFGM